MEKTIRRNALRLLRPTRAEALTLAELSICLLASTVVFFGVEIEKWMIRRGVIYQSSAPGIAQSAP